jgi:uncharacterized membrane protein
MSAGPPNTFTRSVVVNRPAEEVFTFLADLLNDPRWRREWVDARTVSEGDLGVGSRTAGSCGSSGPSSREWAGGRWTGTSRH